jgi:hypothetical protein
MVFTTANGSPATVADSREEAVANFAAYFAMFEDEVDLIDLDLRVIQSAGLSVKDYELGYDAAKAGKLFVVAC